MKKDKIPVLELDFFAQQYTAPSVFPVIRNTLKGNLFSIVNRKDSTEADYISPNRRKFYKILHITGGSSAILTIGLHQYIIDRPVIAFIHPDEVVSWQVTSDSREGHFCLIHPKYFEDQPNLSALFRTYPFFKATNAAIELNEIQSSSIGAHFENIAKEHSSDNNDKREAILLLLQMIFLEAKRAGNRLEDVSVSEHYQHVHSFISLLESSFQIHHPSDIVKIKTAAEFADQLHVHANYLNTIVKQQTGRTLREHIQERLLYEAKVLLLHTDWDINAISLSLGYAEQAGFSSFFHKKEGISPSAFRGTALSGVHI